MVREFVHESAYDHSWSSCVRAYYLRYPNPNATHILSVDVLDRRIEYRPLASHQPARSLQASASASSSSASSSSSISPSETTIPVLCTTRLILKRGNLPKWAPAGLIKNAESWVLEESEVELDLFPPRAGARKESESLGSKSLMGRTKNGRTMRSWSRNIDHTTVLAVSEGLAFKERFGFMAPNDKDKGKGKEREQQPQQLDAAAAGASSDLGLRWRNFCKTITTAEIESHVGIGMLRRRIEKFGLDRFVAHKDTSQQGILWTRDRLDPTFRASPQQQLTKDEQFRRASIPEKKLKILESLRPPFLDGYPLGPLQKLRLWWWSGHYSQVKAIRDGYPIVSDDEEAKHADGLAGDGDSGGVGLVGGGGGSGEREERRYRGEPDESVWRNLSGEAGQGVVYSDVERSAEGGIIYRLRKRLGLRPEAGPGLLARARERLRSLSPATTAEAHRQQDEIDSQRSV
ncbi:uncharacterized protein PFL1_05860 [Pseudozyma flocculosa PF-1]|uniref:Related to UPS1 - mitochondrial intermembrane space protein that regulates mitochondrial cardiolipin levels n=2 Tax=Pseudozyma flocculosa TaxID=84751 RepID=A0A5C3F5F3_9BASI|nr:uncharacterized protein PFL1_05860 [Pseudozyma flocculosa PF-1]EPQ26538.1 hypothetical protein PFL1_05860 [Pseudozyma flocculosa PF-1]SPO38471.1 related to UPS1 - mitochondrial intermembrane space protein that regulates mitochondrial cardiolipin levels [Pseudozyma flocculosa]